jgi:3-oxoadipate enol-lactonase
MPFADANGIRMHYEQEGSGPDVVLIAGLGGHGGGWLPQRRALAESLRVTVFDNRGAGRTDSPDESYSIRLMADDTAALLDALGIAKAHVVGASMGGMIAQELAINHPEKVDRLVLACSRLKPGPVRELMGPIDRWLRENGLDRISVSLLTMPWGMTPTFMQDERRVLERLNLAKRDPYPISRHGYLRQHAAVMAHDTTGRLARIAAPTLVLVGAEDILTPVRESEALAAAIPGSTLRVLPRGGHGFFGEYPAETNAALREFLG